MEQAERAARAEAVHLKTQNRLNTTQFIRTKTVMNLTGQVE